MADRGCSRRFASRGIWREVDNRGSREPRVVMAHTNGAGSPPLKDHHLVGKRKRTGSSEKVETVPESTKENPGTIQYQNDTLHNLLSDILEILKRSEKSPTSTDTWSQIFSTC